MNSCREEYVKIIEDCIGKLISDSEFDYLKDKLGVISEDKDKKIILDTDFVNFIYGCCLIKIEFGNSKFSKMFETSSLEILEDFLWDLVVLGGEIKITEYGFKAYEQVILAINPTPHKHTGARCITYESDASGKVVVSGG